MLTDITAIIKRELCVVMKDNGKNQIVIRESNYDSSIGLPIRFVYSKLPYKVMSYSKDDSGEMVYVCEEQHYEKD